LSIACIGLGSNLNDRNKNLNEAINMIEEGSDIKILRRSRVYQTEPVGPKDQPDFLNMALEIETALSSLELLDFLQGVERKMGRQRRKKWGPRNIDLDLLLYDDQVKNSAKLTLPHPRMHLRRFVLMPLAEIARDKVHPTLKKTIAKLLEDLKEDSKVELF
jgi:2-amino-4-hydroxy-6-hydroxymethyldihydropteridine diphosphokinase